MTIVTAHDILRRKYLKELSTLTGRATIVYATAWMETKAGVDPSAHQISLADVQGFMETISGVTENELDLFLHSPGGSAEGAESILEYLRTQFQHIRVVVPIAAMSAATMLALGADEIVMGAQSQLGPIDPQFTIQTPEGPRSAPGQAIPDQFELAKEECRDPANLPAWLPILRGYLPGLIAQCGHSLALAIELVETWLARYMFADLEEEERIEKAHAVGEWFSGFSRFKSHGRRVGREEAETQGLKIVRLDEDKALQEAVLSAHLLKSVRCGGGYDTSGRRGLTKGRKVGRFGVLVRLHDFADARFTVANYLFDVFVRNHLSPSPSLNPMEN